MKHLTISIKCHRAWDALTLEQNLFFTRYIRRDKDCNEWWADRYKPIEEEQWNERIK